MFDKGSISFRVFSLPEDMPSDAVERFAQASAKPLEYVDATPDWGWVTCRHLMDTEITDQTVRVNGLYHICLRQAVRKVPTALLNAETEREILSRCKAMNVEYLNKKQRKEVKQEVKEHLLPDMPPQLSGIYCVFDNSEHLAYTTSLSKSATENFIGCFKEVIGFEPIPLTPEYLCQSKYNIDADSIPSVCISPVLNYDDGEGNGTLGENFLTWLWFYLDSCNGELPVEKLGSFGMMLDGPLTFVFEGAGAYESVIKKGTPTISAEAKAALMVGKKLKSAKLTLAQDKMEWNCMLDAVEFVFRGMKLPDGEASDRDSVFEERVNFIFTFYTMFNTLFGRFLDEMSSPEKLANYRDKVREWVQEREER